MRTLTEASLTAAFMLHKSYLCDEEIARLYGQRNNEIYNEI